MITSAGHSIEWTLDDSAIVGKVVCHEGEGANCRLQGMVDCGCESWSIERDETGQPFHTVKEWAEAEQQLVEVRHLMMPSTWCNVVEWLSQMDQADLLEECRAESAVVIGSMPIEPLWEGDYYAWEPIVPSPAGYTVIPHGSCDVSDVLRSQWRNGRHWHVVWPDGADWCYETEEAARERVAELDAIAAADGSAQ